jgi:cell fate regulator YaaT (PSP1 superfamily)
VRHQRYLFFMHLIEVAFKGNRKEFFAWEGEDPPPVRAPIVVEADRGEDLGLVHAVGDRASARNAGCAHGCGTAPPARKALRLASTREARQAEELRAQDDAARRKATERVKAHGLVMKLSDAEWQWDRKKLTFYFTAEKRVDFRNLVRDLASLFRARIELKQIGVRDEAKRLDGVGRCGRQYCSASWLPELRPVNLGVAKDQHLSLNPSQISGACGRLMCCLRYEHEFYVQSRKRFPKEGKMLVTPRGEEKVIANDIFNERVTLRMSDGESRVVPLAALRLELEAAGSPLPFGMAAASPASETPPETNGDDATLSDEGGEQSAASLGSDDDARALAVLEEQPEVDEPDVVADAADDPPEARPADDPPEGRPADTRPSADARGPRRRGRRGGRRGRGRGGAPGPGESRDAAQDDSGGNEPPPDGSPSSEPD